MYKEVKGDLIKLALEGKFEVIAHGCNCFCTMGSGIAVAMKNAFKCDTFDSEAPGLKGDINKLGNIDYEYFTDKIDYIRKSNPNDFNCNDILVIVVNAYSQYYYGKNSPGCNQPLDYSALALCLRKINYIFKGKHIGLPQIGCGLAGGDWGLVKEMIQEELTDCDVTVVIYNK